MRRWLAATLLLIVGCSLTTETRTTGQHPWRVATTDACPSSLGGHDGVRNTGGGLSDRLVPGAPTSLLICRYSPLGGAQTPSVRHGILYASARLGAADAQAFAHLLNAIRADHGEHTCPVDVGRYDVLAFSVPGRADVDVWSSSTGCWSFTNGARRTGAPSPALEGYMQRLQQAAPGQLDVEAGADGSRGVIRGRLLAAGMSTRPLLGKVTIRPGDLQPILVGDDGVFAITVAPGVYTLTARSPQYDDGRVECRADAPVHVVADRTVVTNVYCVEK